VGAPLAGRLADRALAPTLYGTLASVAVVSLLLLVLVHSKPAAIAGFILFGLAGADVLSPLQTRLLAAAKGADNASDINPSAPAPCTARPGPASRWRARTVPTRRGTR
jgi:DHA1 family inner membrane transport protein